MSSTSRFVVDFLAAIAALVIVCLTQSVLTHSLIRPDVADFRVVYCGERAAVREHRDPYQVEPLRTCEHRVQREANEPDWSVTPFPLPSYATAALSPLAFLPYRVARAAWTLALIVAFALAVVALARILDTSALAVGLVFTPTLGILNLHYGEPVLISVAALCLAALAVHKRQPTLAALAVAVSLIEPHVGLPGAIGLFVFVPDSRRTLTIAALIAALTGVFTLRVGNLEYLRAFLPAQARAELFADDQFSLSRLLYVLGASPKIAMLLGSVSYGCMTAIGLWTARLLVVRSFTPGLFVLMPVAMAMLGGPFIHDVQVAAAMPAALLLAERSWTARVAVALLALDWSASPIRRLVAALAAATGTSIVVLKTSSPGRRAVYAASALCVVLALGFMLPRKHVPLASVQTPAAPTISATDLSSIPWGWRIRLTPSWSVGGRRTVVPKLPIWIGLALLPFTLLTLRRRLATRRSDAQPAVVTS